ncbi:4'-phosphopantetheinyl transferase superfamily protein [Kitasatospora sp. NPDC056651]|uniref:4'-phosphopantetheinyl transferase family protein n=1 Tax=Kitasatospora sp. NPDC056651 TaxID=3345892 RepID=UPI00368FA348
MAAETANSDVRPAPGPAAPAEVLRTLAATAAGLTAAAGPRLAVAPVGGRAAHHAADLRHAAAMPERRRADFLAGRAALRRALAAAGLAADGPLLPGGRGPGLPPGASASLSHSRGLAVALAAPAAGHPLLGVDLELNGPPAAAAHLVLGPDERAGLDPDAPGAAQYLLECFSAKEAAFKALSPRLGAALPGLRALRLAPAVPLADGWHAVARARAGGPPVRVTVRRLAPGAVLSWALPAEPPVAPDEPCREGTRR